MSRFLPTDAWLRWTVVPFMVFMAMVSDHNYLADFWHHLARGRAMVQAGSLVNQDQFTFTVYGQSFQDVNWLSQLIYHGLFVVGGLPLVQVVNALTLAAAMALLIEVCRRRSGSLFWASLVSAGVFVGIWHVLTIRPQTFSLLLFVVLLDILERAERRPMLLLVPPVLMALWTNLHGAFPAALIVIGCFFAAAWKKKGSGGESERGRGGEGETGRHGDTETRRPLPLALCLGASVLATLVNPYGWGIYLYVGQTSQRAAQRRIDEWMPPTWDLWIGKAFFISLAVLAVLSMCAWKKKGRKGEGEIGGAGKANVSPPLPFSPSPLLPFCFFVLSCSSARMIAWWLLVLGPVVAGLLAGLKPAQQPAPENRPSLGAGLSFGLFMVLAVLSMPGLQQYQPVLILKQTPRVEEDLDRVQAQLRSRFSTGRVFSRFEWGEYLSWSYSPDFPVFMDGRIEIFPDEVWNQYARVTCGAGDWQKILDDYQVDVLILDGEYHARTGLLPQVENSPRWQKQFTSRSALLFVRTPR